jgi:DNA-directed RNA polymerase alpha subunit
VTDDLVKRLREEIVLERLSFGCVSKRRNPDGLEAADRIEQLEESLRKIGKVNNNRYRHIAEIDEIILVMLWTKKDGTMIEKGWLSNRAYNALKGEGIDTLEKIEKEGARSLLRIPNFGRKTLKEVKEFLALRGISLLENGSRQWEQV